LPLLTGARRGLGQVAAAPGLARYRLSLAAVDDAAHRYADRLAHRRATKQLDETIVEAARAWYTDPRAGEGQGDTTRAIAYERFLACAVPELGTLADDQALYRHLADRCFAADPLPFMARVRSRCAPLLRQHADTPSPTYPRTRQKLRGAEAVQIASWESCSDIARAEERMGDGAELVRATDAYLAARLAGNQVTGPLVKR
jgi:hypothetical protein